MLKIVSGSGSSSTSCWRRRSYDHDSDYLRYQKQRVSSRPSVTDYIASGTTSSGIGSGSSSIIGPGRDGGLSSSGVGGSSGLRSRSRSRISDYDPYRRSVEADHIGGGSGGGGSSHFTSSYGGSGSGAGSHYYSHYCGPRGTTSGGASGDLDVDPSSMRHPRPPDFPQMTTLEVSGRTRRYHPADK